MSNAPAAPPRLLDLIAKKRGGGRHTPEELNAIVRAASRGEAPDYQLAAWLMAVCWRGMSEPETVELTRAMARSGATLSVKAARGPKVDKHSTGGVGDGISLALAPLAAAAGLVVPMMSGRGLAHTGGTLDKLESIPGFRVTLTIDEIERQLAEVGAAMFGQSESLAPADRKLYHLRDATATVESLPLVVSSILSKKVAEGLDALVLDVKVGTGAIFQDPRQAETLGRALVKTARRMGLRSVALLSSMDQPLGRCVGNALEVKQAIEVLQGDCTAGDYVECLLALGGWMAHLGGKAPSPEKGAELLEGLIRNGQAAARFKAMIAAQGGDPGVVDDPGRLPRAAASKMVPASRAGYLSKLDARQVGQAAVLLGAGRTRMDDKVDFAAGIRLDKKLGDRVDTGESVARLYASDPAKLEQAARYLESALQVSPRKPRVPPVIRKVLK